jgi:hypothetical protein
MCPHFRPALRQRQRGAPLPVVWIRQLPIDPAPPTGRINSAGISAREPLEPRIYGLDGPAIAGVPDRRGPVPSDHAAERHPSCSSLNGSGDKAVPERPHSEVARDPRQERVLGEVPQFRQTF